MKHPTQTSIGKPSWDRTPNFQNLNSMEQAALCTALVAGICMDSKDPAETIINIMTAAADLMDRMEETHQ